VSHHHPLISGGAYIAYFAPLSIALGSQPMRAIIVQHLWNASRETGEAAMTHAQLAQETGMAESTLRRHVAWLKAEGILSVRRASAMNATSVWVVNPHAIPDVPKMSNSICSPTEQIDVLKMSTCRSEPRQNEQVDLLKMSTSTVLRKSIYPPTPLLDPHADNLSGLPAEVGTVRPEWARVNWMDDDTWQRACRKAKHVDLADVFDNMVVWCRENKKPMTGSRLLTFLDNAEARWVNANRTAPGDEDWVANAAKWLDQQRREERKEV
jgi:hypothetical protein